MRTRVSRAVDRLALAFVACAWASTAMAADVVAVRSSTHKAYDSILAGFRDEWRSSLEVVGLPGKGDDEKAWEERLRACAPRLILALGPQAAAFMASRLPDVPLVCCMAGAAAGKRDKRTVVVASDPLPSSQLAAFQQVLPALRRLATVYNPATTGAFVDRAKTAAAGLGVELIALPISSKKEVPAAIQRAFREGEAVWLLRDAMVMSKDLLAQTLLQQVESKKPVLVYAESFVREGALAAHVTSYREQGRTAARVALELLGGADPDGMPEREAKAVLWVNAKTAAQLGLKLQGGLAELPGVKLLGP